MINKCFSRNNIRNYIVITLIMHSIFFPLHAYSDNWYRSYGDNKSSRHIDVNTIDNNKLTKILFEKNNSFKLGDENLKGPQAPSLFINGNLYLLVDGSLIAYSIEKNKILWKVFVDSPWNSRGFSIAKIKNNFIAFVPSKNGIIAINTTDGYVQKELGNDGRFQVGSQVLVPPILVDNNSLYIASSLNGVFAFNLNGKVLWHTSLKKGGVTPRIWSGFSYDEESENLYLVTSNNAGIVYKNTEQNYSSSLLALSSNTGRILWSMQETKSDVWDFDMAGSPLIGSKNGIPYVVGLSKTPSVFYLRGSDGKPMLKGGLEEYCPEPLVQLKEKFCPQLRSSNPEPLYNASISIENLRINNENKSLITQKIKYATLDRYTVPSIEKDVVLKGLHGGVTRSGGAIDPSGNIFIPYNNEPWILRVFYVDKIYKVLQKLQEFYENFFTSKVLEKYRWDTFVEKNSAILKAYKYIPFIGNNKNYYKFCSSCHGDGYQGFIESESKGDQFYPSLTGISKSDRFHSLDTVEQFLSNHEHFANLLPREDLRKIIAEQKNFIIRRDKVLDFFSLYHKEGRWGLLLGADKMSAIQPPWSGLTSINLHDGKKAWTKHLGEVLVDGKTVGGAMTFGGVISIGKNLLITGAGSDGLFYAIRKSDGQILHKEALAGPSSATPTPFIFKDCLYLAFISGNVGFMGFPKIHPTLEIYKTNLCKLAS